MDDVYENIDDYNLSRQRKILIVFDDVIADITTNKKFQTMIKDLLIDAENKTFHLLLSCSLIFLL